MIGALALAKRSLIQLNRPAASPSNWLKLRPRPPRRPFQSWRSRSWWRPSLGSCSQRCWATSVPSLPISRPPQSTPSIGAPVSRSAAVTSTSPSSNTTAAQRASRGRASSGVSRGSSISASPSSRAREPTKTASIGMAVAGIILALLRVGACPPGGIGRRAGFRYQWLRSWGFKSPGGHGEKGRKQRPFRI